MALTIEKITEQYDGLSGRRPDAKNAFVAAVLATTAVAAAASAVQLGHSNISRFFEKYVLVLQYASVPRALVIIGPPSETMVQATRLAIPPSHIPLSAMKGVFTQAHRGAFGLIYDGYEAIEDSATGRSQLLLVRRPVLQWANDELNWDPVDFFHKLRKLADRIWPPVPPDSQGVREIKRIALFHIAMVVKGMRSCARCGLSAGSRKRCAKCLLVAYCSRDCQQLHWPDHKQVCNRSHSLLSPRTDEERASLRALLMA